MASSQETPIAVDQTFQQSDEDSSYGSELVSYTTSLASAATDYRYHMGRRYHAKEDSSYAFPNDEKESDRLDVAHQMLTVCLGNKLFNAPIKDPKRVLDLGTGTGIWAIDFGDKYPNAEVIGNDLSPIQPRWVPPNVQFEVDDIEQEWTYSKKFDFIHVRTLYGAIKDWPGLVQKVFNFLEPGGYAEFYDFDLVVTSPDNTLPEGSPLHQFNSTYIDIARKGGTDPCPGVSLEKWVRDAGFADVEVKKLPLPIGTWPKDKLLKEVGAWNFLQVNEGLEGFVAFIFSTVLGWSKDEVDVLCAKVRRQIKDRKTHGLFYAYNVVARKPQ